MLRLSYPGRFAMFEGQNGNRKAKYENANRSRLCFVRLCQKTVELSCAIVAPIIAVENVSEPAAGLCMRYIYCAADNALAIERLGNIRDYMQKSLLLTVFEFGLNQYFYI